MIMEKAYFKLVSSIFDKYGIRYGLLLVLCLFAIVPRSEAASFDNVRGAEIVLFESDLQDGVANGAKLTEQGITLGGTANGIFVSASIKAPVPFTDVGPQWLVDLPEGSDFQLEIRTSPDGENWNDWIHVEGDLDWVHPETNEWVGDLVGVPQSAPVHNYVQLRWMLTAAPDGSTPVVQRIRLAFIDAENALLENTFSSLSSTGDEKSYNAQTSSGYNKPPVTSRTAWGCPDGQNSPSWDKEYVTVSHILVHHTVTPNDDTNHAARVLSIWYYHAVTRGWGDIGYNYLIARDGSLYEGRAGGDDVVAGHAYPYNEGSLGLAFMGTFVSDPVPQAMMDSAADLIAWKAYQKGFDPEGSAYLKDIRIKRISGHRDVAQTACPGDVLYGLLPNLRKEVSSLMDEALSTYVDENQAEFSGPAEYWHTFNGDCGYNGDAVWTFSVDAEPSVNSAIWRPNISKTGAYRVLAYIPFCSNGYTDSVGVTYKIHHSGGNSYVQVNQASVAGSWVELGTFNFDSGTGGYVSLTDVAVTRNQSIWFDAIKWRWDEKGVEVISPPVNKSPANGIWSNNSQVNFKWSASSTSDIDNYRFIVATDSNFSNIIKDKSVDYANADYSVTFSKDYSNLYWAVEAYKGTNHSVLSTPWKIGIDTTDPTASISRIIVFEDGAYLITWVGQDATSGVANYDVEYSLNGSTGWVRWLTQTSYTNSRWPNSVTQPIYFRVRATDKAGNLGDFDDGHVNTTSATLVFPQMYFPIIFGN